MNKYQEALNKVLMDNPKILLTTSDIHHSILLLKKLVDKETPKHVVKRTMPIIDEVYCCSKCGHHVGLIQNYCDYCGQRLDWEGEDE